ncbi:unnamed protein product [Allacma fusca]|uniref:Uncharacterized protein n=1 Tax=Allacma fusca TaxID=39272 RepID=A0A8J2NV58_9HEXA|nr:unnamed protein product [Allacma fusca]
MTPSFKQPYSGILTSTYLGNHSKLARQGAPILPLTLTPSQVLPRTFLLFFVSSSEGLRDIRVNFKETFDLSIRIYHGWSRSPRSR